MKEYSQAITPTRERTAHPLRLRISRILLAGKPSACRGAGMCPACPPRSLLATACRGAGMCPACFLSTALPLRRLAQAQAQWMPMQLMKVRTPCTRAPYAMRVSHMHLRTLRTARLTCAPAALRGAASACGALAVTAHGALAIAPLSMRPDTLCSTPTCSSRSKLAQTEP